MRGDFRQAGPRQQPAAGEPGPPGEPERKEAGIIHCGHPAATYTGTCLKPTGKSMGGVLLAAALLALTAGCGGISGSKSVSPLDFILPGLMKANPPPWPTAPGVPATNRAEVFVARVR